MVLQRLLLNPEGEQILAEIYNNAKGNRWNKRLAVSMSVGYIDAKFMCYYHETHGVHLVDQLIHLRRQGLRYMIPYTDLKHELLCLCKSEASVNSMLAELKKFDFVPNKEVMNGS